MDLSNQTTTHDHDLHTIVRAKHHSCVPSSSSSACWLLSCGPAGIADEMDGEALHEVGDLWIGWRSRLCEPVTCSTLL